MNKLWCLGITQNRIDKITNLVNTTSPYVDGFVWTDHFSTDGTFEFLNERKKEGRIYQILFTKNHSLSMTYALTAGHVQMGDWVLILDSSDLPNEIWLKGLRDDISYYEKNGINTVFLDRPLLFKYYDNQSFVNPVHWGLYPPNGKIVNLSQIEGYRKENYIFNTRDMLNSGVRHPAKYYYEYGLSNQCELLYSQFGTEVYNYHENLRLHFRLFCFFTLKIGLTLDSLIKYMVENVGRYPEFFEQVLEIEPNVKDMFRLYVLNESLESLLRNRMDWSYFIWKNSGDKEQINSGFESQWNKYKKAAGLPLN